MTQNAFDFGAGQVLKLFGLDRAEAARPDFLEIARSAVRRAALSRSSRTATADDAYRGLISCGYDADVLGNAAGAIFRGSEWKAVGWAPSERVSNHGRYIRVWRLDQ